MKFHRKGERKMKAKRFMGLILVLLLFVVPSTFANNIGITLADLLKVGAFVIIDDKKFYEFTDYSSISTGANASPIAPANIFVVPLIETIDGIQEWGLRFHSELYFAGARSTQDTLWKYTVATLEGGDLIVDNVLRVGGYAATGNGFARIGETAQDETGVIIANKEVGDVGEIDIENFGPQNKLIISTDILLAGLDGSAFISEVDQLYSQTGEVPEPISLILLGSGLLGLAGLRKKFFKK